MTRTASDRTITLGISTGCVRQHLTLPETLGFYRRVGVTAVELGYAALQKEQPLQPSDLQGFRRVTLHAPKADYGDAVVTQAIFTEIERINDFCPLKLIVFHPDLVPDLSLLATCPVPFALENMDHRKPSHQRASEMQSALNNSATAGMVLDLNHIYTNDPSMKLADNFYTALRGHIIQVHVSGYRPLAHEPLFKTKQTVILDALQDTAVPIIVEGEMKPDDVTRELDYILDRLSRHAVSAP